MLAIIDNKNEMCIVRPLSSYCPPTDMLEKELQKFGLSDKEACVYLALLELDASGVSEISKKSKINRSTTYVLLESLKKKGLVATAGEKEKDVLLFTATSPDRLQQLAEESVKKYTELVGIAQNIVPELKSMHKGTKKKPRVRYFEDTEGLISAYEDTLTATETIRAFASIGDMHTTLPSYFPEYYMRRVAKNIHIKSIHPDTKEARERTEHDTEEMRESALVPKDEYDFSPEINIYDDKIVFMSLVEKFALIVESEELATALKKVFDLSWEEATRLNKKITT